MRGPGTGTWLGLEIRAWFPPCIKGTLDPARWAPSQTQIAFVTPWLKALPCLPSALNSQGPSPVCLTSDDLPNYAILCSHPQLLRINSLVFPPGTCGSHPVRPTLCVPPCANPERAQRLRRSSLLAFYRQGNGGSEMLSHLPEVTQQGWDYLVPSPFS